MAIQISFTTTETQRKAVYRLRYEQYCEAQGLLHERADHKARILCEEDDINARLLIASQNDRLLGTMRIQWGGDGAFGSEIARTFSTDRFAGILRPDQLAVGSRFIIHPNARGTTLMVSMVTKCFEFCLEHGVELLFGDCEPHLVQLYRRLGFRTYKALVNHETSGVLVPLVLACSDLDYLTQVRSPLRHALRAARGESFAGNTSYAGLLPPTEAIVSADPKNQEGLGESLVAHLLNEEEYRPDLFQDLDPEQVQRLLARSDVLRCAKGDALIRASHTSRTLYVILEGALEVWRGDKVVAVLSRGNVFGEIAFLIDARRTADVIAAQDGVRVLALSEANLSRLISSEAELAAKLLLNLSRALCFKLATEIRTSD